MYAYGAWYRGWCHLDALRSASISSQNCVIAKDAKSFTFCWCHMHDINCTSSGECLGPKQVHIITMHSLDFHTKVVQAKGWLSAILCSSGLWTCARCVVWSLVAVRMAIEPNYHRNILIHKTSNNLIRIFFMSFFLNFLV